MFTHEVGHFHPAVMDGRMNELTITSFHLLYKHFNRYTDTYQTMKALPRHKSQAKVARERYTQEANTQDMYIPQVQQDLGRGFHIPGMRAPISFSFFLSVSLSFTFGMHVLLFLQQQAWLQLQPGTNWLQTRVYHNYHQPRLNFHSSSIQFFRLTPQIPS